MLPEAHALGAVDAAAAYGITKEAWAPLLGAGAGTLLGTIAADPDEKGQGAVLGGLAGLASGAGAAWTGNKLRQGAEWGIKQIPTAALDVMDPMAKFRREFNANLPLAWKGQTAPSKKYPDGLQTRLYRMPQGREGSQQGGKNKGMRKEPDFVDTKGRGYIRGSPDLGGPAWRKDSRPKGQQRSSYVPTNLKPASWGEKLQDRFVHGVEDAGKYFGTTVPNNVRDLKNHFTQTIPGTMMAGARAARDTFLDAGRAVGRGAAGAASAVGSGARAVGRGAAGAARATGRALKDYGKFVVKTFSEKNAETSLGVGIPGTPTSLSFRSKDERLPGMHRWVPRDVIEHAYAGLDGGLEPADVIESEGRRGNLLHPLIGAGIGGALAHFGLPNGGVAGKAIGTLAGAGLGAGYNEFTAPFREDDAREALYGIQRERQADFPIKSQAMHTAAAATPMLISSGGGEL